MVDKPFPLGLALGAPNATTGITLGTRFRATESVALKGFYLDATAAMAGVSARFYEVGGLAGGDGQIHREESGLASVVGDNYWPFDTPLEVVTGRLYGVTVTLPNGGSYGFVNPGAVVSDPPLTGPTSEYIGVFDPDGVPPITMAISSGESTDAPWTDSFNYYGVGVYYDADSLYEAMVCHAVRVDENTNRVTWEDVADDPYGVTILRAPGAHVVDGNGAAQGETGYDPSTIDGAEIIATGDMASPYIDVHGASGIYTYAVIRTGPGG